jgi:NAD(P)-dependent dehydrogenase (short-subunit alcohol dehydrogenase family)
MKKYIITGGSSGMGYAIAAELLRKDNSVIIVSRNAESSDLSKHKNCIAKNVDISKVDEIKEFLSWYKTQPENTVDALVNCAGIGWGKLLADTKEEEYEKMFNINVKGLIFMTQGIVPFIKEQAGIICNFSSIAGIKGFSEWSLYCASKYAVEGFTQSIRYELRPKGIRVISVKPGSVDTPFYEKLKLEEKKDFIKPETVAYLVTTILDIPKEAVVEDIFINNAVGDL